MIAESSAESELYALATARKGSKEHETSST